MRLFLSFLFFTFSLMVAFAVHAESADKNKLFEQIGGSPVTETIISTEKVDNDIRTTGTAVAEVGTKACILVFFVSFLLQLLGTILNHPGYTKWSRMMMLGSIIGFVVVRMAPITLSQF